MASPVFHILGAVLVVLDFVIWVLTLGPIWWVVTIMSRTSVRARIIDQADVNGELPPSAVWRHFQAAAEGKLVERPFPEEQKKTQTVWDLANRAMRLYSSLPALGSRELVEIRKLKDSDRFPAKIFGRTQWLSYAQVETKVKKFGAALCMNLGMKPQDYGPDRTYENTPAPNTLLLYEDTCAEWFIAALGAHSQAIAVATAYASLGVESVTQAVEEGAVTVVMCNRTNVQKLIDFKCKGNMGTLKHIIYTDLGVPSSEIRKLSPDLKNSGLQVHAFEEFIENAPVKEVQPPQPHHCAVLMYTSGSTGKPKGIVCLHRQLVSLISALAMQIKIGEHESLVGYLPLAHIFEMQMEFFTFGYGGTIGYADPKTLTAGPGKCMMLQADGSLAPKGALEEFRPTIMGAVPKVWEVIKSGAEAKVKAGGGVKEYLFNLALALKSKAVPQGRYTPLFDLLVFRKFKAILGGRLKVAVSGGGAIHPSVQSWVRTAFGCPLVQGYGLTETCAGLTIQMIDDYRLGVAGSPLPTLDVLLASVPDVCDAEGKPYLATDRVHLGQSVHGRGEVWCKGHNVTSGYYKMPEQTREAWTADGWFKTGDIAVMLPDGSLKIVDRKKNLAKLKGGEYVALEKMNLALKNAAIVHPDNGGVCVIADDSLDRPVCLVQCQNSVLQEIAAEAGVSGTPAQLCNEPKVREAVLAQLRATGKSQGLTAALEQICAVGLLHEDQAWTPDNGCLTATQKLVPSKVRVQFSKEIEELKARVAAGKP